MLTLHFKNPITGAADVFGPAPFFRIDGRWLLAGPDDLVVAEYRNSVWQFGGVGFQVIECNQAHVQMGATVSLGPFSVTLVDGALWEGPGLAKLLATLEEMGSIWRLQPSGTAVSSVILKP